MNINKIEQKLREHKDSFYEHKKELLMKAYNLNSYDKTAEAYSLNVNILSMYGAVIVFSLSFFLSALTLSKIVEHMVAIHMFLSCIIVSGLPTFGFTVYFKKLYHSLVLKSIKNNEKNISDFLVLEHDTELNKTMISEDIHNLLKVELSDKEYLDLRNNGLTYYNVNKIISTKLDAIRQIERNKEFLNEKIIISLSKNEIDELCINHTN